MPSYREALAYAGTADLTNPMMGEGWTEWLIHFGDAQREIQARKGVAKYGLGAEPSIESDSVG